MDLQTILATKNWQTLYDGCLETELQGVEPQMEVNYSLEMAACLLLNKTGAARFLWKRIPLKFKKQSKELVALWKVGQALFKRQLPAFYAAVEMFPWSNIISGFILALREETVERRRKLIAASYSSVSLLKLAELLGMTQPQAVQYVVSLGWRADNNNMVFPTPSTHNRDQEATLKQLDQLTLYVSSLETEIEM